VANQLLLFSKGETAYIHPLEVNALSRRVTFRMQNPKATEILLAGDFNKWEPKANPLNRDEDGIWQTTLRLPPGRYEFKFLVDGAWREPTQNEHTVINGLGTLNNVVIIPEAPRANDAQFSSQSPPLIASERSKRKTPVKMQPSKNVNAVSKQSPKVTKIKGASTSGSMIQSGAETPEFPWNPSDPNALIFKQIYKMAENPEL
jgi:hypothetical protein